MGIAQSSQTKRKGVQYDKNRPLVDQLKAVEEENWSPIARLHPFIFHCLGLRISVQASWSTHCAYDEEGVECSYPHWNGYFAPAAQRSPFPLQKAKSFELGIEELDEPEQPTGKELKSGLLTPQVMEKWLPVDTVSELMSFWEGDEVGSYIPQQLVVNMLNQLADAEAREYDAQVQRTTERVSVYKEELMQHVWHPVHIHRFDTIE